MKNKKLIISMMIMIFVMVAGPAYAADLSMFERIGNKVALVITAVAAGLGIGCLGIGFIKYMLARTSPQTEDAISLMSRSIIGFGGAVLIQGIWAIVKWIFE